MKKIIYIIAAAAGIFVYTIGVMQVGIYMGGRKAEAEPAPDIHVSEAATKYTVKLYEGEVWVFPPGSDTPQRKLNIDVASLRKADKEMFRQGLTVDSLEEILHLEEDFSG